MSSRLAEKKSKVIVVDPSGPVRQMMVETVRTVLGFETVEGKASVQDVLQLLEVDHVDWVIMPLMADQPVNALHLLKLCTEDSGLKGVRLSLLVDDAEKYALIPAFEMGLLSWHRKPFTKDSLTEELKALQAQLAAQDQNEPRTSAHYLRLALKEKKAYAALVGLGKNLLDLYPGHAQTLLSIAEPQFQLGQRDAARLTLEQVKILDPKLGDKAAELAKSLFGEVAPAAAGDGASLGFNVLGATNVVVIDSDQATGRGVEDILKHLGVASINYFGDGEAAWAHLVAAPEPDLVITEWRVPKLSGPMLVQRLRHHGFLTVPVVVLSSLLKPVDMPFVKEIGVAAIVQKPLNKDLFVPSLIHTMQQERQPTELQVLERKIRHALKGGGGPQAEQLRAQLFANPQVPPARKRLIEAEFAFAAGNYVQARDAAIDALKFAGESILVLNLLGKSFLRLSSFDSALKCFQKAQALSPNNLERLCLIAETQTELGDHAAAQDSLENASSLDPDAAQVADAAAKVAITKGDTDAAKKLMGQLESIDSIIAYMNNKAVAMARCGQAGEAIDLYKKTAASVPDNRLDPRAVVHYNLALALIRAGDLDEANIRLTEVLKMKGSRVERKAGSLKERLKQSLEKGLEFKLKSTEDAPPPASGAAAAAPGQPAQGDAHLTSLDEVRHLAAAVDARRGDICCYLLFVCPELADMRATSLLAKPPRFAKREAIERSESFGAEKSAKGA